MKSKCLILTLMLVIIPWIGSETMAERPRLRGPSSPKRTITVRYDHHNRRHRHRSRISSQSVRRSHVLKRDRCRLRTPRRRHQRFRTNNNQVNVVVHTTIIQHTSRPQPRISRRSTHRTIIVGSRSGFRMKTRSEIVAESMKKIGR